MQENEDGDEDDDDWESFEEEVQHQSLCERCLERGDFRSLRTLVKNRLDRMPKTYLYTSKEIALGITMDAYRRLYDKRIFELGNMETVRRAMMMMNRIATMMKRMHSHDGKSK